LANGAVAAGDWGNAVATYAGAASYAILYISAAAGVDTALPFTDLL